MRIRLISRGMKEVLHSRGVRSDMERRAKNVVAEARRNAPVDTGAYRASIQMKSVTTDRAVARAVADIAYGITVEARLRVLGRAIDAAR